ncbi:MAG: RHS repeat-associated core domain-containing protein, partial [Clostridia bacterium]|nr:RHS repeat-associated core domain-containing protein [Clostridia bacterium]
GSQYQVVREYDAWGFPKRIKTMKNGNPSEIENLYYTFDFKRGNLTQRSTYKYYKFENFTYDALERLKTETISGNALATSYADNGNILTRSDVGTYGYSQTNAGPHAVTAITDATGTLLPDHNQSVSYTPFNKVSHISQRGYDNFITYGPDRLRRRTSLHTGIGDDVLLTKYYGFGDYEKEVTQTGTRHLHYIAGGDGLAAVYVKYDTGEDTLFHIMQDHLGSIVGAINSESGKVYRQSFDAWGRNRNPQNWTYDDIPSYFPLDRGFTGHEHLKWFGLINMNGRMYDASLCRFLSPDPFVQMPDYSQNFNRYSYALNNPLVYTDPSGEIVWAPIIIGAIVGAYIGGSTANGTYNPAQWDYSSGRTWGYMLGGAVVGGVSGGLAHSVATSGMAFANTASIVSGSFVNSVGTHIYTGGQTDVSVGFGFGSYNFSSGEFGYLGKRGNSALENIGYGLGALANVADILAGFKPGSVELRTENDPQYYKTVDADGNPIYQKDLIGHSQITDKNGNPLVDWGPVDGVEGFGDWVPGTNSYERGVPIPSSQMKWDALTIDGVNTSRISNWNPSGKYNLCFNSCVSQTSRALNSSGVFNVGIHPYLLHGQMFLRSVGVRPYLFSSYLYQY